MDEDSNKSKQELKDEGKSPVKSHSHNVKSRKISKNSNSHIDTEQSIKNSRRTNVNLAEIKIDLEGNIE